MSAAKSSARCSKRIDERNQTPCLVSEKSRLPIPSGVTASVEGQTVKVKGPKGALAARAAWRRRGQGRGRRASRSIRAARPSARARCGAPTARCVANLIDGRHQGLRAAARDHRRRLSRGGAGQEPAAPARLQPRHRLSDPRGHHDRGCRSRPRSSSPASTGRRSARSRPKSAPSASPSPTRARASSTRANTSSARKARRSDGSCAMATVADRTLRRTAKVRRQCPARRGRPRAAVGVPLVEAHLRAGDRRREGRDGCRRPPRSRRTCAAASRPAPISRRRRRSASCVAERAAAKGVKDVVFDRGGYLYHGRVKALADAAREGGLNF